jgi:integrase/recombinase XerD
MNSKESIAGFLHYLELKNFSKNTSSAYSLDINEFISFFKITKISKIQDIDLKKYRSFLIYLKNKNNCDKSIQRKISSIKSFTIYLKKEKIIESSSINLISVRKTQKNLPRTFNEEMVLKFLNHILTDSTKSAKENLRNFCISRLMLILGLRVSEVLSIQVSQLNNDYLQITGKGKKMRQVPLFDELKDEIKRYIVFTTLTNDDKLFNITPRAVQKIFQDAANYLSIRNLTPHKLRHSCATMILNNGGNIRKIQTLLGHSNLSTTQIYSQVSKEKIKKIIKNTLS